jgi:RNA ligase (TIGR02306 family)
MSRSLATIQQIKSLSDIPGADNIEVAQILGWKCVVKRGEFTVGSQCVYVEVDSILPDDPEKYEFLRSRGFRIKTIKLKGQVSQGICFPLNILIDKRYQFVNGNWRQLHDIVTNTIIELHEGSDVTEILNITKYEPYIPANLRGKIKGQFPKFLRKTDETRIQTVPQILERYKNKNFYVTEKLDGSSMTVYLKDGVFGVCSRNLDLAETEDNSFWKTARKLYLEDKLKSLNGNWCIQGELVGNGVQKNKYGFSDLKFFVFNLYDIDKFQFVDFMAAQEVFNKLELQTVPLIETNLLLNHTVDQLVEYSKGHSTLNLSTKREGLVFRSLEEVEDPDLGRLSFKVINPDFLLKYTDE